MLKGSQREPAAHKGLLSETLRKSSKKALHMESLGLKLINPFYLLLVSVPPQPGQQWPGSPLFLSLFTALYLNARQLFKHLDHGRVILSPPTGRSGHEKQLVRRRS